MRRVITSITASLPWRDAIEIEMIRRTGQKPFDTIVENGIQQFEVARPVGRVKSGNAIAHIGHGAGDPRRTDPSPPHSYCNDILRTAAGRLVIRVDPVPHHLLGRIRRCRPRTAWRAT